MKKKYVSSKIIIAGFPGVGKSEAAKLIPGVVMDVESSDYHWNEDKSLNPLWPDNYLDYVKILLETDGLEEYKDLLYICISTHADTLKRLRKLQIPFVIAVPEDKEETIARYKERGNSEAFIKQLDEHWEEWMKDFEDYDMPVLTVPKGHYLSELLYKPSYYDMLKSMVDATYTHVLSVEEEYNPMDEFFDGLIGDKKE